MVDLAVTSPRAAAVTDSAEFDLVIGGMTCAACAAWVQAMLNKLDGVTATVTSPPAERTSPPRPAFPPRTSSS